MDISEIWRNIDCAFVDDEVANGYGEKWVRLSRGSDEYEFLSKCIDDADVSKISLYCNGIVSVDSGEHYIATFHGGLNGARLENKWCEYLEGISRVMRNINKTGESKSWIIGIDNDCCDDLFVVAMGVSIK